MTTEEYLQIKGTVEYEDWLLDSAYKAMTEPADKMTRPIPFPLPRRYIELPAELAFQVPTLSFDTIAFRQ